MYKFKETAAREVYSYNLALNPRLWLEQEVNDLALKHNKLDEMPLLAILPLVYLYAHGPEDKAKISRSLEMNRADVDEYLEFLCEFRFIEPHESTNKYKLTESGESACKSIITNMINRKIFEMKGQVHHLESLHKKLDSL